MVGKVTRDVEIVWRNRSSLFIIKATTDGEGFGGGTVCIEDVSVVGTIIEESFGEFSG